MLRKLQHMSIYYKIIFIFLLVITPIYTINILFNLESASTLRNEMLNSMSSRISFYTQQLDREIGNILSMQNNMAADSQLQLFAVSGDYLSPIDRKGIIDEIERMLLQIKDSNNYIKDVQVYFFNSKESISANNALDSMNVDQVEPILRSHPFDPLVFMNDSLYLRITYPDPIWSLKSKQIPLFMIQTEISVPDLKKMLSNFSLNRPEKIFMINRDQPWMISSNHVNDSIQMQLASKAVSSSQTIYQISIHNNKYLVAEDQSQSFRFSLIAYAPLNAVIHPVLKLQRWFWWLSCIMLLILLIFSFSINQLIHKPFKTLIRSFRKVEIGKFDERILVDRQDEFYYLFTRFNQMLEQIRNLIESVYQQKIRAQQAELKQLQSQINPHFLYNSLFVLHQMVVMNDYVNLETYSKNLSQYFKMITRNAIQFIRLEEEVEYAKHYVQIQQFRFSNRLSVRFGQIPDEVKKFVVPRLILQPILENAFEHGHKETLENGFVSVLFKLKEDWLMIEVEDNGEGMDKDKIVQLQQKMQQEEDFAFMESTGIINVHKRLKLNFGTGSGLKIEQLDPGLRVRLIIPISGGKQNVSDISRG